MVSRSQVIDFQLSDINGCMQDPSLAMAPLVLMIRAPLITPLATSPSMARDRRIRMEPEPAPDWETLTPLLLVAAMELTVTERPNQVTMLSKWAMVSNSVRTLDLPKPQLISHSCSVISFYTPNGIIKSLTFLHSHLLGHALSHVTPFTLVFGP